MQLTCLPLSKPRPHSLNNFRIPGKKCRKLFREPSKRFKSEQLMKKSRGGFLLLQKIQTYNSIFHQNCAKTVVTKSVGVKKNYSFAMEKTSQKMCNCLICQRDLMEQIGVLESGNLRLTQLLMLGFSVGFFFPLKNFISSKIRKFEKPLCGLKKNMAGSTFALALRGVLQGRLPFRILRHARNPEQYTLV